MATVTKIFQRSLSRRLPSIHFRYGLEHQTSTETTAQTESSEPIKTSPSKHAKKQVVFEFHQTPKKYRRRPLTQDEIDLVTIGGCA